MSSLPSRPRLRAIGRWLRPKSAGVRVTRAASRRIERGNRARDAADWAGAALAYRAALDLMPGLMHIWMQFGNVLREAGDGAAARDAYATAARIAPANREAHLLLAEIARLNDDPAAAIRHATAAFRLDRRDHGVRIALLRALSASRAEHRVLLDEIAASAGIGTAPHPAAAADDAVRLWVDVGDLLGHFARARLPSGLQRVQIEVATAMLALEPERIAMCCHVAAANGWVPLPAARFAALVDLAMAGDDVAEPQWQALLTATFHAIAMAPPLRLRPGATLFNLGMAWAERSYPETVAAAKRGSAIRFAALACDVIPLTTPDQLPADIVEACGRWLDGLAANADAIVAISEATRRDVLAVAARRGTPIAPDAIGVARLDGRFAPTGGGVLGADALGRWGLRDGRYVLYVSTVEPRKNHLAALAAWDMLRADLAAEAMPTLVCVGRMGWMSAPVERRLAERPDLARHVRMLAGISDAALDLLYRHCAFTLYPSLYEGWGLPVTESLCYGKVPAIGQTSSLPEAGGDFAVYYDAADPRAIAEAVGALVRDPEHRALRERRIRATFAPRPWSAIARDMLDLAMPQPV